MALHLWIITKPDNVIFNLTLSGSDSVCFDLPQVSRRRRSKAGTDEDDGADSRGGEQVVGDDDRLSGGDGLRLNDPDHRWLRRGHSQYSTWRETTQQHIHTGT